MDPRLPERMFRSGVFDGSRKTNAYCNLSWIGTTTSVLSANHLRILHESQFGRILQMGDHTNSVKFIHLLLTLQLKTTKKYELWWEFSGKPMRYAIDDFAYATGLNCEPGKDILRAKTSEIWKSLFSTGDAATPEWIVRHKLLDKKELQKLDDLKKFRLVLLVLVEGVVCPKGNTDSTGSVRPHVVEMLRDVDQFLKFPWGRESFLRTVKSIKSQSPYSIFQQKSISVAGFSHAITIVAACNCPALIGLPSQLNDEEKIMSVCGMKLNVSRYSARNLHMAGTVSFLFSFSFSFFFYCQLSLSSYSY